MGIRIKLIVGVLLVFLLTIIVDVLLLRLLLWLQLTLWIIVPLSVWFVLTLIHALMRTASKEIEQQYKKKKLM